MDTALFKQRSLSSTLPNRLENSGLLRASQTIETLDTKRKAIDLSGQMGHQYNANLDRIVENCHRFRAPIQYRQVNKVPECCFIKAELCNIDTLLRVLSIDNQQILHVLLQTRSRSASGTHVIILDSDKWNSERTRILFYRKFLTEARLSEYDKQLLSHQIKLQPNATHIITSMLLGIEFLMVLRGGPDLSIPEVDDHLQKLCLALRTNSELDSNDVRYLDNLQIIRTYINSPMQIPQINTNSVYEHIRYNMKYDNCPIFHFLRPIQIGTVYTEISNGSIYNIQAELFSFHLLLNKVQLLLSRYNGLYLCEQFEKIKRKYHAIQNRLRNQIIGVHKGEVHEQELFEYLLQPDYRALRVELQQVIEKLQSYPSSSYHNSLNSNRNDDINILLVGETGVGKSTFINALANHMHFTSLKQAQQSDPVILISSSFIITRRPQFHEITINIGTPDSNENNNNRGESVTQRCKSYPITIDNYPLLTIVDTPGVGDTRGVKQDDININNIHSFMEQLDHINAICFLMKPNVERLHPSFRLCLTQLLNMVDSNARKNIVFCFTNTRATFYAPGNTGVLLNDLLDKLPGERISFENANTFCFDSESFRYLAATKQDIEFDEKEKRDYKASWSKSVDETKRFLEYIKSLDKIILQRDIDSRTEQEEF